MFVTSLHSTAKLWHSKHVYRCMITCTHVLSMQMIRSSAAEKEKPLTDPQVDIYVQHNHCWVCFHDACAGTVGLMEKCKSHGNITTEQPTISFSWVKWAKKNHVGQHNHRISSLHFDADVSGRASFRLGFELGISEFICLAQLQAVQISHCNIFERQWGKF